jgi:putative transposase
MIVGDNGTELTSNAMLRWQARTGVLWHYITPGKPQQNGFVESFMYGRPPRCKKDFDVRRRSGAFMYSACLCGLHDRWP